MNKGHADTIHNSGQSDVTAEACAWIAQLETGDTTRADMEAFKEWVSRSPYHAAEMKRMAQLSLSLNQLSDMAPSLTQATQEHHKVMKGGFSQPRIWAPAMAVMLVVMGFFLTILIPDSPPETATYFTRVGESKSVSLSDGSIVTLNTDSRIAVTYSDDNRIIKLLKGEAYFDVASNKQRPFWVYTENDRVRVVGTEFLIKYVEDTFKLMVTEGVVNVAQFAFEKSTPDAEQFALITDDKLQNKAVELIAGQQIELAEQVAPEELIALVTPVSAKQQRQELSWQDGFHDFTDMALSDVAEEVSRYVPEQVIVADPSLKTLRFSGIFRVGEPKVLYEALEQSYGLDVVRVDAKTVEIRKRT